MTEQNIIRDQNLIKLKQLLFEKKKMFKAEMAKETGISTVTINSLVKQLLEEGVITEGEKAQPALGRPATIYHFNEAQAYYLLLSIQEKHQDDVRRLMIHGSIVNLTGDVEYIHEFEFIDISLEFLLDKLKYFLTLDYPIKRIALSIPGKIHQGVILSSWHELFNGWNIEEALLEITDLPIIIQNDAHLLTMGYTILKQMERQDTKVGIYYPEKSLPGISIYSHGTIIEGGHNLAGEAKYLPHLLESPMPANELELLINLLEIIAIYNAVIAPDVFIISTKLVEKQALLDYIARSSIITKQVNQPKVYIFDDFQLALTHGLHWLALQGSDYVV